MISHDRARRLGKHDVGALNPGDADLCALMTPTASVRVGGERGDLALLHEVAPPTRTSIAGSRRDGDHLVVTVRVVTASGREEREHRLLVGPDGLIEEIVA